MRKKLEHWPFHPIELFLRCVEYTGAVGGQLDELNVAGAGTDQLNYIQQP